MWWICCSRSTPAISQASYGEHQILLLSPIPETRTEELRYLIPPFRTY